MLYNDLFLLETLILFSLVYYVTSLNLLTLLYVGGIYLVLLGFFLFLNDADLFIGFLWVIDLGVGLVFFVFIVHFTVFFLQKSNYLVSYRNFIFGLGYLLICLFMFFYFNSSSDNTLYRDLQKTWQYKITYCDYYLIYHTYEITELNFLLNLYFSINSFEFFMINFNLLFGLFCVILMCYLIRKISHLTNYDHIINANIYKHIDSNFFIRTQNYTRQQNASSAVRIWGKKK